MSCLAKTMKFSGKEYRLHDDYLKLDTAEWEASKLRGHGWNVRIVRSFGLYGVYKRRK